MPFRTSILPNSDSPTAASPGKHSGFLGQSVPFSAFGFNRIEACSQAKPLWIPSNSDHSARNMNLPLPAGLASPLTKPVDNSDKNRGSSNCGTVANHPEHERKIRLP
jgi:hypothetical protein